MVKFSKDEVRLIAANGGLPLLSSGRKFPILLRRYEDTPEELQPEWLATAAAHDYREAAGDADKRQDAIIGQLMAAMNLFQSRGLSVQPLFDLFLSMLELRLGRTPPLFKAKSHGVGGDNEPKIIASIGWAYLAAALKAKYVLDRSKSKAQRIALLIDLETVGDEMDLDKIFGNRQRQSNDKVEKRQRTLGKIFEEFQKGEYRRAGDRIDGKEMNFAQCVFDNLTINVEGAPRLVLDQLYHVGIREARRFFLNNGAPTNTSV